MEYYLVFHIVCSILVYGSLFAYMQRELSPENENEYPIDLLASFLLGLLGPLMIVPIIFMTRGFNSGFKFI